MPTRAWLGSGGRAISRSACFCDKYGCQFPPALTQPAHQQLVSHSRVIQTMRFAPSVRLSGSGAARPIRGLVSGPKLVANNHTYFTACSQQGSKKKTCQTPCRKTEMHGNEGQNRGPGVSLQVEDRTARGEWFGQGRLMNV